MTNLLIGAVLGCGALAIIEGVLLFGRAQVLLNQSEQILALLEPPLLPAVVAVVEPDADTDEMPAIERPQPAPGPRTVPSEQAITVAAITDTDDWLTRWREQTDADIAAMKRGWEAA